MRYLTLCLTAFAIGCGRYEVKLNENTVYTPPPTVVAELADSGLRNCVTRALADSPTMAMKLTTLDCSAAGIRSLVGLSAFERLERLNLANNDLTELAELATLPKLRELDLSGNAGLSCAAVRALPAIIEVVQPAHCQ